MCENMLYFLSTSLDPGPKQCFLLKQQKFNPIIPWRHNKKNVLYIFSSSVLDILQMAVKECISSWEAELSQCDFISVSHAGNKEVIS